MYFLAAATLVEVDHGVLVRGVVVGGGRDLAGHSVVHLVAPRAPEAPVVYWCEPVDQCTVVPVAMAREHIETHRAAQRGSGASRELSPAQEEQQRQLIAAELAERELVERRGQQRRQRASHRAARKQKLQAQADRQKTRWVDLIPRLTLLPTGRLGVVLQAMAELRAAWRTISGLVHRYADWLIRCPLGGGVLTNPVLAPNGHCYNAANLGEWSTVWPGRPPPVAYPGDGAPGPVGLRRFVRKLTLRI